MQRVLFSTAVGPMPDYGRLTTRRRVFGLRMPVPPFGIRFLQANIPGIDTLEYPDWEQFHARLADVDLLGISFFMRDVPVVREMVQAARAAGVQRIIGGGYGVLCEDIQELFDQIFIGYAEDAVSKLLTGKPIDELRHPPLPTSLGIPGVPLKKVGFLFTMRGCGRKCLFCQSGAFAPGVSFLPLGSIEQILDAYAEQGIKSIFIMNENFDPGLAHSQAVIDLIRERGMEWGCMTRASLLEGKVGQLRENGFNAALIGLESLRPEGLKYVRKGTTVKRMLATVDELRAHRVTVQGSFIVGYPADKPEDMQLDIDRLCTLDIQLCQILVLTPYPQTDLWRSIEAEYGIFEQDYGKFDGYHLVFNHPHISPDGMQEFLAAAYRQFYSTGRWAQHLLQPISRRLAGKDKAPRKTKPRSEAW